MSLLGLLLFGGAMAGLGALVAAWYFGTASSIPEPTPERMQRALQRQLVEAYEPVREAADAYLQAQHEHAQAILERSNAAHAKT